MSSYFALQDTVLSINVLPRDDNPEDENTGQEPSTMQKVLSVVKSVASGLKPVLELTKEVSDAFPPLKGVVSGILAVWKIYDVGTNICLRCQ